MNRTYKDTQTTNEWLKDNGFNVRTFNQTKTLVLRAQQAAKLLLDEYQQELTREQCAMLRRFQQDAANSKLRDKISNGKCYAVLNIQTKYNRKLFERNRKCKTWL
jgi:hypothetical protein